VAKAECWRYQAGRNDRQLSRRECSLRRRERFAGSPVFGFVKLFSRFPAEYRKPGITPPLKLHPFICLVLRTWLSDADFGPVEVCAHTVTR
jgi:hypothetical protein